VAFLIKFISCMTFHFHIFVLIFKNTYSGTNLVTNLQSGEVRSVQDSWGTSWTTVLISFRQTALPLVKGQGPGPQISRGFFLHYCIKLLLLLLLFWCKYYVKILFTSVSGVYLLTLVFSKVHTCLGHLSHLFSVE
jgi:hypothetical protein